MINGTLISSGKIGLFPVLRVNAPALSTIDIYFSSVVIASYTLVGEETTHDFEVYKTGIYTVTATRDTQTKSQDVLVEMACIYEVKIVYLLYLYNQGDECSSVTGGWSSGYLPTAQSFYYRVGTFTKKTSSLYFYGSGRCGVGSHNNTAVDTTGYTKCCFNVSSIYRGSTSYSHPRFTVNDTYSYTEGTEDAACNMTATGVYTLNIASIKRSEYFVPMVLSESSTVYMEVNKIWIE